MKKKLVILAKEKQYFSFHSINKEVGNGWYIELCLLQKWLREVHNIEVDVMRYTYSGGEYQGKCYMWAIDKYNPNYNPETEDPWILETRQSQGYDFKVYEEALEIGLQEALKLI